MLILTGKQPKLQGKYYFKYADATFVGLMPVGVATTDRLAARLAHSSRNTQHAPGTPPPLLVAESGIHTRADVGRRFLCLILQR
jgi:hypothetical protein